MKVSIITVCKNSEQTIEKTIQSVISQSYSNIEFLIIDGASEDKTLEIVQKNRHQFMKVISEPDSGIYAAMNKGIRAATGDFLYFLNADDYLFETTTIETVAQFIAAHPECDLVYGDHQARFPTGDTGIYQPAQPNRMLEELICIGDRQLLQPATFFRAGVFQRVGLFNESYRIAGDYEWFLRFLQQAELKLCYLPCPIVSYAHGGASSNIRSLFEEIFAIQNQSSVCQETHWLLKRLDKLQTMFVDKYELLESTNKLSIARYRDIQARDAEIATLKTRLAENRQNEALQTEIASLRAEINAMKTSKFWQLRTLWFRVKKTIGLPTDD